MTAAPLSYARSTGRPRRLVLDPWVDRPGRGAAAGRPGDGRLGVDRRVRPRDSATPFFYFQRQLDVRRGSGSCAAVIAVTHPDRALGEVLDGAAGRARSLLLLLVLVPGIGHEVNGSRRWVRLGFMNFQVSELARVLLLTLRRELRGASRRRAARRLQGLHEAGRRARCARRCCCCASRTSAPRPCCWPPASPCCSSPARGCATCWCRVVLGVGGDERARGHLVVPAAAPDRVPRSLGGPVRQRLPAHAVADRDRPRRVVRRRPRLERAEALLPARGAHRLRVRGAGRGVRLRRRGAWCSACSRCWSGARSRSRATRREAGLHVPVLPRGRHRHLARPAGVREHRREHGCAADQGPDAAAAVLRRQQHAGHARLARRAAAHPPRDAGDRPLGRARARRGAHDAATWH